MATPFSLSTSAYRPRWELGAALAYSGALVALVAANWGLFWLGERHRVWGFVVAAALTAAYLTCAVAAIRRRELLAGGLTATLAATAAPWMAAAIVRPHEGIAGFGSSRRLLDDTYLLQHQPHGLGWRWIVVDIVALAAALALLHVTRFALLAVPAIFATWFLAQEVAALGLPQSSHSSVYSIETTHGPLDTMTSTPLRIALAAFASAVVYLAAGLFADRSGWRSAFWGHFAAPIAVVVGLLALDARVRGGAIPAAGAVLGCAGVVLAIRIGRSAYGVAGGLGLLVSTLYFAAKLVHGGSLGFPFVIVLLALALGVAGLAIARRSAT